MGNAKQPTKDLLAALKATTPDKSSLRAAVAEALDLLHAKANAMDVQSAQSPADFAATKTSQYAAFLAALPDVGDPP